MLIGSTYQSPRLRYAAEVVFRNYQGTIEFTSDPEYFSNRPGPKLNYGLIPDSSGMTIVPTDALWNEVIEKQHISITSWNGIDVIVWDKKPFDIFASTFFMVSRYEEYLPCLRDQHGRFSASDSVFASDKKYRSPLVDLWRIEFEKQLSRCFPSIEWDRTSFSLQPTIDVDSAFAYRYKGLYRTVGAMVKDIFSLRIANLSERIRCLIGANPDPYDTYDFIIESANRHGIQPRWFFLLSDYSKQNINISHRSVRLRELIVQLDEHGKVGIHPGYQVTESLAMYKLEIARLNEIVKRKVTDSRQHYLKMALPQTYRNLLDAGIVNDFTMGFADDCGYRAGTSLPFRWFDIEKNETTELMVHPFASMDTTLNKYLCHTPEEAIEILQQMISISKDTQLPFCFLWHNETLSEKGIWKNWRQVWNAIFDSAV